MNDIVTPKRLATQSSGLCYRVEKAGLTLDHLPIPWSADTVIVEGLLRLPPAARRRTDFLLYVPGRAPELPELLTAEESIRKHRVVFRIPPPSSTCRAELCWRNHVLGAIDLPVVSREQFLEDLEVVSQSSFAAIGGRSVSASTTVSGQVKSWINTVVVRSPSGLAGLADVGLRAEYRSADGRDTAVVDVPPASGQAAVKESTFAVTAPRIPRRSGEWSVQWCAGPRVLAASRRRIISGARFIESLRVSDGRLILRTADGTTRVVRRLGNESYDRIGPCFIVAGNETGLAGEIDYEISLRVPGAVRAPTLWNGRTLMTDGPNVLACGTIDRGDIGSAVGFELRTRDTVIGLIHLSAAPAAQLTAEGGFTPPPDFPWSTPADDELSERLAKLMGEIDPSGNDPPP